MYTTMMPHPAAVNTYELEHALSNHEIQAFFQPIIQPRPFDILGVELLARWNHPQFGILPPQYFIPPLEEMGKLQQLSRILYRQALYTMKQWLEEDISACLHINLSKSTWYDDTHLDFLTQCAKDYGITTEKICFECSQHNLEWHGPNIRYPLKKYLNAGFHLGMDDFILNHRIEAWMKTNLFSHLKLPKAKVDIILQHRSFYNIMRKILSQTKKYVKQITAIGIERKVEQTKMLALGCNSIQGHLYKPALSAPMCLDWIKKTWS